MIVSHRHRFVFIRTRKTAGTSIEVALTPLLGPDDIIVGAERRNADPRLKAHDGWPKVRKIVGAEAVRGYWRFCFERNPWSKCVSEWRFKRSIGLDYSFEESLASPKLPVEWEKYAGPNGMTCAVFRYEDIDRAWPMICARIGVPCRPLPRLKDVGGGDYRAVYRRRTRKIVAHAFSREIRQFRYRF